MRKRLRIGRITGMNKLLTIAAAAATIVAAMAEPETRRAIPVNHEAALPAEPQARRAIPVSQVAIDAEMLAAAEAVVNKPAPTEEPATEAPVADYAEPPIDHGVGANVLWQKYDQNPIAADNKYRGVRRTILGSIKDIGRDIMGNPYVIIGDRRIPGGVQCTFTTDDEPEIAELRKGQLVAINGEIKGLILFNVLVSDCAFVEIPPMSNKQRAAQERRHHLEKQEASE